MLCKKPFDGFMHRFSIMTSKLQEIYQMTTFSGNFELELVDSLDPVSEGVNFRSASPFPLFNPDGVRNMSLGAVWNCIKGTGLPSLKIWSQGLIGLLRWPKCIRINQGWNPISFCHVMYKPEYKVRVFFK